MRADQPACYELEPALLEGGEQLEQIGRREQLKHRRVVRRVPAEEEPQPVLEAKGVRDRADERPSRAEDAVRLLDE